MVINYANEDGIKILRSMSHDIVEAAENMEESIKRVKYMMDEKEAVIGPHMAMLKGALEDIVDIVKGSYDNIQRIAETDEKLADTYECFLDEFPFN